MNSETKTKSPKGTSSTSNEVINELIIPLKADPAYYATEVQEFKTANLIKLKYSDPRSLYPKVIASWWVGKNMKQDDTSLWRFSDGLGIDIEKTLQKYVNLIDCDHKISKE